VESIRPIVLSIAGFDPSGGAGVLADIKTFEQLKVYGLGISTSQTLQTEDKFLSIRWEKEHDILLALETMLIHYEIKAIKIGIVENLGVLEKIVSFIHKSNASIKIVLDTVIKSSTGFTFWNNGIEDNTWKRILSKVYVITPNYEEAIQLVNAQDAKESSVQLSQYCNVVLKGGHNSEELGVDYLYKGSKVIKLEASTTQVFAKHGSGCVLSAAITANLALGNDLLTACKLSKKYIEQFLISNKTLLGYHHVG
jgi:hydroxymethylpyrimidine/phosphomethylpyrimidine kinase